VPTIPTSRTLFGFDGMFSHDSLSNAAVATLSSATHFAAAFFLADQAKAIRRIGFYCTTKNGTPTFSVRLEGITGFNNPNNTVKGGSSDPPDPASASTSSFSVGWNWVTLTNDYTPTVNEHLAAVVRYESGATSGTVFRGVNAAYNYMPHGAYNVGSNQVDHFAPGIAVEYSDGTLVYGFGGMVNTAGTLTYNTGSNPDENGVLIVLPHAVRTIGAMLDARGATTTGDFTVKLYDASNTLLGSANVTAVALAGTGANGHITVFWASALTLPAGTYRLTVLPTTANSVTVNIIPFVTAALRVNCGFAFGRTHRTDATGWTDVATDALFMGLVIDAVVAPAFAGGFDNG